MNIFRTLAVLGLCSLFLSFLYMVKRTRDKDTVFRIGSFEIRITGDLEPALIFIIGIPVFCAEGDVQDLMLVVSIFIMTHAWTYNQ